MKKIIAMTTLMLLSASGIASAAEYSCKAYCLTNSGKKGYVYITVYASSRADAADKASYEAGAFCKSSNYRDATSGKMFPSQCSAK